MAAAACVKTSEARAALSNFLLKSDRLAAVHNTGTFRLYSPQTAKMQDFWQENGECGTRERLKNILWKNLMNMAVFVSCGTDGSDLGNRRHKLLEEIAEIALDNLLRNDSWDKCEYIIACKLKGGVLDNQRGHPRFCKKNHLALSLHCPPTKKKNLALEFFEKNNLDLQYTTEMEAHMKVYMKELSIQLISPELL